MLRLFTLFSCLFLTLFAVGLSAHAETSFTARLSSEEKMTRRVVQLTNEVRARYHLAPLHVHSALMHSAAWMAQDMAQHNYLRHTDCKGREIDPRLPELGYGDYREIGENIAGGQLTADEVVADWLRSPGHRANLLNPDFREIGVSHAVAPHTHYKHYWVQDFGSRNDVYPVVINNEALLTTDANVHLYLHGADWAGQMRFSNDGSHWSEWEPFQSQRDWTLETGYGKRTIFVELRGGGMVRRSADTIALLPPRQDTLIASAVTLRPAQ